MKYLLTSLGFQETGFIEENNEVAMRLDLKKENRMTKKALISVSDKAGIVEFAHELKTCWDIRWQNCCP